MVKKILQFSLILAIGVGATFYGTQKWIEKELKRMSLSVGFIREITPEESQKLFLYEEVLRNGLNYKNFSLLRDIIKCESSWRQFWNDGNVVISSGNVGLGQINILAHKKTYTAMGLDIFEPYDNLRFVVFLYKRDGIRPWLKWSGHCWNK